jgi:dTDP-4-dehydrorhamnose 3,5-epimerase
MNIISTGFNGLLILEPKVLGDSRGYFMESYNRNTLEGLSINTVFVQDNQSSSRKGVLRGLHFQRAPHAQTKLVRTLTGSILDVVVDLRKNEPTFGKHFSVELTGENKRQLLVPKGFAHGFIVLSDIAEVFYKCDEYYNQPADGGIHYSSVDVDWQLPSTSFILSDKDKNLPSLAKDSYHF